MIVIVNDNLFGDKRMWHGRTQAIITLEDGHEETVTEVGNVETDETICYITDGKSDNLIIAAPDLLDAIKQIKVLNAGRDNDIAWLCQQATDSIE